MTTSTPPLTPPRYATPRNLDRPTAGPLVAELARRLRRPLLPWAELAVDVLLEVDVDAGELVYPLGLVSVGRQQGKTTALLPYKLLRLVAAPILRRRFGLRLPARQRVIYTAQTGKAAEEKVREDELPLLELADPALRRRLVGRRMSQGSMALHFPHGRLNVVAPNDDAGRGGSIDLAVIDEARQLGEGAVEAAIDPTMTTRPCAQKVLASNAGDDTSTWWADKLALGRLFVDVGRLDGVALVDYGAGVDDDPADPATWARAMPAWGALTQSRAVAGMWEQAAHAGPAGVERFRREMLNVWAPSAELEVPLALWRELADDRVPILDPVALAVELDVDRTRATIVAAGLTPDRRVVVEVLDQAPGTLWVADRLEQLEARWEPCAVVRDGGGPAAGLDLDGVDNMTTRDLVAASGAWHDDLGAHPARLTHRADPILDAAAAATRRRPAVGAWLYDRGHGPRDASAWLAAVEARWALRRHLR